MATGSPQLHGRRLLATLVKVSSLYHRTVGHEMVQLFWAVVRMCSIRVALSWGGEGGIPVPPDSQKAQGVLPPGRLPPFNGTAHVASLHHVTGVAGFVQPSVMPRCQGAASAEDPPDILLHQGPLELLGWPAVSPSTWGRR